LAAFGRRPPVNIARLSMAGIRNPAQLRTHAPQQTVPRFDVPDQGQAPCILGRDRLALKRLEA
jgi:hypothetical protein